MNFVDTAVTIFTKPKRVISSAVAAYTTVVTKSVSTDARQSVSKIKSKLPPADFTKGFRLGIDTHADSSCAGKHVRIL